MNQSPGNGITIVPSPTPSSSERTETPSPTPGRQLIDINWASVEVLESLPGIGEVKAQAIETYRTENGPFRYIYELLQVPGIGAKTLEGLKDLITVGAAP